MPLTQTAAALSVMISVGAVGHITTALGSGEIIVYSAQYRFIAGARNFVDCLAVRVLCGAVSGNVSSVFYDYQGCYEYLHVLVFRFPFSISLMVMCDIVRSDGMASLSSYSVMIQQCSNIIMISCS